MAANDPMDRDFSQVDDRRIEDFERSWLIDQPKSIRECLPPDGDSAYLGTLEELVHIDREFRWKAFGLSRGSAKPPPSLEDCLEEFPELAQVKLGLIRGEFELVHRFDCGVSVDEFVRRFGESVAGQPLRPQLETQLRASLRDRPVRPGSMLGRYEIVNEHGRGGFGAVWRAKDTKLGRRIAVKQLGQRLANDSESRRRFISEARVTARLEHPGIVPVYDISNVEENHAYYTMRLIQGRTMAEAIADLHNLEPRSNEFQLLRQRLLQSFVDVCRTIEYAHAQGVVHRDLKPQNIIVGDYGETILLDWGLANVLEVPPGSLADLPVDSDSVQGLGEDPEVLTVKEANETMRSGALGTPAYMPPEQARGEMAKISYCSDVYSLGATLYQLLTGCIPFSDGPFESMMDRVKAGQIPPAHERNPLVEKPLSFIARRAMKPDIDERYRSVSELVNDVQRFQADQPVSAYRDPWLARTARWIRKHPTTAAMTALTVCFAMLTVAAAFYINNEWRAREEKRISRLQIAAERADATAISQIKSGRFDAAVNTLAQGLELIQSEPDLEKLASQISNRENRTRRILDFYTLGMKAQEETFLDRTQWSAKYCQAAVNQLGILDRTDWWNDLPDEDLTPLQQEQLRAEAYRITTLLASMRFAETAKEAITVEMFLNPKSVSPDDPGIESIKAARFAAQAANRYRPSRAMQLFIDVADFSTGKTPAVDLTNLNPLNATDSAVMGSVLDNNVPAEGPVRSAMSALLEFRDPNLVARQWLNDALKYDPDWYWLPVFVGHSQVRTGQPEEAIQTLSHAVGIRPNFWVGYQYRAIASVAAASQQQSRKRRTELLNAASRDIQRGLDLEPNNSELYWTQAIILSQEASNPDQICETYLKAFSLHPGLEDIRGGHYTGISKNFFSLAKAFVDWHRAEKSPTAETALLEMSIAAWQSELELAIELGEAATKEFADDRNLQAMLQLIRNRVDLEKGLMIEWDADSQFGWHFTFSNAKVLGQQGKWAQAEKLLERGLTMAKAEWQITLTQVALARSLVESGDFDRAAEWVSRTTELDRAADLTAVALAAGEAGAQQVTEVCNLFQLQIGPKTKFADSVSETISHPALLNGDFELGLSYHWAPFSRRTTATSWNNNGQSRTTATAVATDPQQGHRCLSLKLDCPEEADSFGLMSQTVPVTPGQRYTLSFWARIGSPSDGAVVVGQSDGTGNEFVESVTLDNQPENWKQYHVIIVSESEEATIAIRAQGQGQVWLDNFSMALADDK